MPLILEIKVMPSSSKQECILDKNQGIKCYLKSPPEKGKANHELVKFLSKSLDIGQEKISIISGMTSRLKRVKIDMAITFEELLTLMNLELPVTLTKSDDLMHQKKIY